MAEVNEVQEKLDELAGALDDPAAA